MEYIYSCEIFNPHNVNHTESIIVNEAGFITSPAYLHTFKEKSSNEKYCVVSDNIGIPMPYLKKNNEFIIGTSRFVYFFDVTSQKTERKSLNSPCTRIINFHNKIIIICESGATIISLAEKSVVAEYGFSDVISDYKMYQDYLLVQLMEGSEHKIDI